MEKSKESRYPRRCGEGDGRREGVVKAGTATSGRGYWYGHLQASIRVMGIGDVVEVCSETSMPIPWCQGIGVPDRGATS